MLYISKIDDFLKILTHEEVKDFVAINSRECFKSKREEQNLRKVAKYFYIFLTASNQLEEYVQSSSSDDCMIIVYYTI